MPAGAGVPQIVAPGCYDLVDVIGWQELAAKWEGYPTHAHNRLITSVVLREADCLMVADAHLERLAGAKGPTALLLPAGGCGEWDRPGADLHNPDGLSAFMARLLAACPETVEPITLMRISMMMHLPRRRLPFSTAGWRPAGCRSPNSGQPRLPIPCRPVLLPGKGVRWGRPQVNRAMAAKGAESEKLESDSGLNRKDGFG